VYVEGMTADNTGEIMPVPLQGLIPSEQRVERAAGDFRRGAPVLIRAQTDGQSGLAVAAETVRDGTLRALAGIAGPASLILTHARAATLKIRLYTAEFVSIPLAANMNAAEIRAIADPATDLDFPLKGPFEASRNAPLQAAGAAVKLAKLAGLLPAAVLFPIADNARDRVRMDGGLSDVFASDISGFADRAAETLQLVTRASVPLEGAEEAELAAFRPLNGGPEHYAIVIGAKNAPALASPGPVLTRLHSECFTGDLLGSLKCDCGDQLRGAIQRIAKEGGGILLYLAQEGRGIGLVNKLRAYALQDRGLDTLDANRALGWGADERTFLVAATMLEELGLREVRLLTNNPDKVAALAACGVVVQREPHAIAPNGVNNHYLATKAARFGHLLD
jgi:GTP cyclohydrolase II